MGLARSRKMAGLLGRQGVAVVQKLRKAQGHLRSGGQRNLQQAFLHNRFSRIGQKGLECGAAIFSIGLQVAKVCQPPLRWQFFPEKSLYVLYRDLDFRES